MLSKVEILKQKILGDISAGRIRPGQALPSRHQFMRRYGCARGSIDVAVGELVQSGYLYSRKGSGTFVATPQASKKATEVFVVDDFTSPDQVGRYLQSGLLAAEIQRRMPCYVYHNSEVNVNLDRITRPGSAVIWVRSSYAQLQAMDFLASAGIPQILIGRSFRNYDCITTDPFSGIRAGLEWLTGCSGLKEPVAFVSPVNVPDLPYIGERQIAFYRNCVDMGISLRPEWIFEMKFENMRDDLNMLVDSLFGGKNCPRSIFLSHITAAFPLITMAEARGKLPGRDFNILLFDDEPKLRGCPGIAMLRQRWDDMWSEAVSWVLQERDGSFRKKLQPELLTP
ncbi:MAG: hypothetical protein A2X49_05110 [Lentisphaerae bacterium GWF2_52_8]|nr:MAG: hypothetical protein A2X49_05110 [Lentisphaerae bacterium GWF2_52_8]